MISPITMSPCLRSKLNSTNFINKSDGFTTPLMHFNSNDFSFTQKYVANQDTSMCLIRCKRLLLLARCIAEILHTCISVGLFWLTLKTYNARLRPLALLDYKNIYIINYTHFYC